MADWDEVVQLIQRLEREFQDLAARGLRTVGPQHLASLEAICDELARTNAVHLAGRIEKVVEAIRNDDRGAAAALLRAQATLRLFERMLTKEVAAATLEAVLAEQGEDEP
jgi:hypothetical protein